MKRPLLMAGLSSLNIFVMKAGIVIPARYGSSRFPGKPLAKIHGKPLVVHVLERAKSVKNAVKVIVATDDERIADVVSSNGGEAVMTPLDISTGTERVLYAASESDWDIIVNLQGDEPLLAPRIVEELIDSFERDSEHDIATAAALSGSYEDFTDPNVVKVVVDSAGYALYFSRSSIPYNREGEFKGFWKHVGIYAFRMRCAGKLLTLPPGRLERIENLEQLRWMEAGMRIRVIATDYEPVGVDTPADVAKVEKLMVERG